MVHISINMWDICGDTNQRVDIFADEIAPDQFKIVFRTWADTRVARVRAEWLAIGPVPHVDQWGAV